MAGFPLMAIGAGIGQAAQAWQQQQEARQRTMMLQLQLQRWQREDQERKDKEAGAAAQWDSPPLGAGAPAGVTPVGPGSMGGASLPPSSGGIPSAASLPPMGADGAAPNMGRNFTTPGAAPNRMVGFQTSAPPAARSPLPAGQGGAFSSDGDRWMAGATSVPLGRGSNVRPGPWSATNTPTPDDDARWPYTGPGAGSEWSPGPVTRASGSTKDATMPTIPPRSGRNAPQMGPAAPYSSLSSDVGEIAGRALAFQREQQAAQQPQAAQPQMAQAQPSPQGAGGARPQGTPTAPASAGGNDTAPPDLQKLLDAVPKPDLRSRVNEEAIKAAINQRYPMLPPTQKLEIFKNELAKGKAIEDEHAKLEMKAYDRRLDTVLETWKEQNTRTGRALEGGEMVVVDGKLYRQKGGTAAPVIAGGQPVTGATRLPSPSETESGSKNIQVLGPDGKEIFAGAAHKAPGATPGETSWIDDATQKRIVSPEGSHVVVKGEGDPGKQAAGMMIRLTNAAQQAKKQIPNIARASAGMTNSWFQGIQSETGKNLSEGLRRTLANYLTPQEEQIMKVLGRGMGRTLASLETAGAATGLIALQQSFEGMLPAKGDDRFTALLKIADMTQIAEQAIEGAIAAPAVGKEQRDLMRSVMTEIRTAVPYTVGDVLNLTNKPGAETYQSFAAKIGLGVKKGAPAAAGAPTAQPGQASPAEGQAPGAAIPAEAIAELKRDASPARRQQFDAVFGTGAAAKALGQ